MSLVTRATNILKSPKTEWDVIDQETTTPQPLVMGYVLPLVGVGIEQYIASSGQTDALKRAINIQLAADGYKVNDILVQGTNENFTYSIDAERS